MENIKQQLIDLFQKTGQAHHQAFIDTDGFDPSFDVVNTSISYKICPHKFAGQDGKRSEIWRSLSSIKKSPIFPQNK